MLPGSQLPPYRPPCEGTVLCGNGPRYQHAKPDEKNIPVYLYDSKVCDWHWDDCGNINPNCENGCNQFTDCGGGTIDPYERYAIPTPGAPCSSPGGCAGTDDCTEPPCQSCGPWCYDAMYPGPTPSWYQPWTCTEIEIVDGGSGYVVGETLTAVGGTASNWINPNGSGSGENGTTAIVTSVDGTGKILSLAIQDPGSYQTVPSSPNAMTGVIYGSGASINLTFAPQTEDLSICHKYGYKNVQALRYWHGADGYYYNQGDIGEYQCPTDDAGDMCNYSFYSNYNDTATQTKYTTLAYDLTYDLTDLSGSGSDVSVEQAATISVDPSSGIMSASGITNTDSLDYISNFMSGENNVLEQGFNYDTGPIGWLQTIAGLFPYSELGDSGYIFSCDSGGWSVTDNNPGSDTYGVVLEYATWSIGSGSASGEFFDYYDLSLGDYSVKWNFSISDNSLSFYYIEYFPENYQLVVTFTVNLSGSNTSSDIQSDINTLLNEWDLTDDALYPWRTDQYTSIAPLVTRDEVQGNVSPWNAGRLDSSWTDPNSGHFTGDIVGSPMPAGYQGYFDFNYVDYQYCADGSPPYMYEYGFGQKNTGQFGIPLNATQWTNNQIALQYSGGAWIFYNANPSYIGWGDPGSNYNYVPAPFCIAQKWAETKMGFASQNFFRPAGADKFSYDETNVLAINSTNTTNGVTKVYLIDPVTCSPANTTANPGTQIVCNDANASISNGSGIWGGPAVNGFFEVAGNGNPFTLGNKAFDLPSDWQSRANWGNGTDSSNCFGELRFPNAPAILGRAGISNSNGNANTTTLTTQTLTTLGMGVGSTDQIDIYDEFMNLLASNKSVTRVDDTHFTIPVSHSTVANAAYAMSNGAPAYYWDDTYPKGDYAYTDWTWWPRQIGEANQWNNFLGGCESTSTEAEDTEGYPCDCPSGAETVPAFAFSVFTQEAGCLGFSTCSPSVLCISPNDESFAVGHTYSFPTIDFDEEYGSGWQAEIQQVMQDLLWQTPHFPATNSCSPAAFAWLPDNGLCNESGGTTYYFAHPPLVECRISLPNNGGPSSNTAAPALPSSTASCCSVAETVIGWTSPVGFVSGACFPNNTLFPPNSNGFELQAPGVWSIWENECTCIEGSGNFASDYENNVLGCT